MQALPTRSKVGLKCERKIVQVISMAIRTDLSIRRLRRDALDKIASLSVGSPSAGKQTDIGKISRRCPGTRTRANGSIGGLAPGQSNNSRIPMVSRILVSPSLPLLLTSPAELA